MGYLAKAKQIVDKQKLDSSNKDSFDNLSYMSLLEFSKRNLAIPIYSELLNEEIWFCSSQYMLERIKKDNPKAVCYLSQELIEILKKKPSCEELMKIHLTKKVFDGKLIE